MPKDQIFARPSPVTDFQFNQETATVFDDMVTRGVPFYQEIQRMTGEIASDFAVDGTNLYDLGCATGTTLVNLDPLISPAVRFVGVDNAGAMLERARQKLVEHHVTRPHELVVIDLERGLTVENASVVIMILTLQFVRPPYRRQLIESVVSGLNDRGCLILVEKLTMPDPLFSRVFIEYYHDLKRRNGYSDLEIARKREALENVLIPYRLEENRELLVSAGLSHFEVFFRWYNFGGMIGVK